MHSKNSSQQNNLQSTSSGKQTNQCAELTAILTTLKKIASTPELSTKKVLIVQIQRVSHKRPIVQDVKRKKILKKTLQIKK